MTGFSTRTALLAAAGCLVLTGCGPAKSPVAAAGGSPAATSTTSAPATTAAAPAGGGGGLTACDIVSEQDATTAMGSAAGPGTAGGTAALSECIYADGALIVGMKPDSKALYDSSHDGALAKGAKAVPGVGDSAFLAVIDGQHCTLEFLKGTTLVSIIFSGPSAEDGAIEVAKTAASKI
jgi:hypothetical protein